MSIYKNVIERLDEFTTRQGIVSGEWCKLLDMLESEREYLEANNAEFEKQNVILAHQLKYAETIITEVQADKFKLREKLDVAMEALGDWIEWEDKQIQKDGAYIGAEITGLIAKGRSALEKIKAK